jgi:glycerol uptake facilitator protein
MTPFLAEFIGTSLLITLGGGVVANVVLNKTKGNNAGWIVITFGWAMGVYVGVFVAAPYSGAHLNPAVTIALAVAGKFEWASVVPYIGAQLLGAMAGALLVWIAYRQHFNETDDGDSKLAVFSTGPAIRKPFDNFMTELIGTFVLVFAVLFIAGPTINLNNTDGKMGLGAVGALPVAFLVLAVGLSLGGPTGYAINPARDIGPRIMHFILPIGKKRDSDWSYAWIPVLAPIVGGVLAAALYKLI